MLEKNRGASHLRSDNSQVLLAFRVRFFPIFAELTAEAERERTTAAAGV